jgi:hypothetical protein
MSELILEASAAASWHRVVREAEARLRCPLDEECESYLILTLHHYLSRPELVRSVIALRFLDALTERGRHRCESMREVGDQCLLFAGLFPEQATRRRVSPSYFIDMGRTAYSEVADGTPAALGELYQGLAEAFATLADVLFEIRGDADVNARIRHAPPEPQDWPRYRH